MNDVDEALRIELDRLVPVDVRRDWRDVVVRAGLRRERARRGLAISAAVVAGAVVLGVATPLGATLARSLDDFSAWLSGEPGTPASESEQRAFDEANARSWLRFPEGTRLRQLVTTTAGDSTVTLLGFRSGTSTLCLRLSVTGETPATTMSCAPLAELRRAGGPARAVIVDHGVGKGDKLAWYGIDRYHSSKLQITAGIAADGVRSVVLEDDAGRHEVAVSSNAFLYVAEEPDVGQRVTGIWARTGDRLVAVPFAPAPFGIGSSAPTRPAPAAPAIERQVSGGRIAWLESHETRGESLDVLPPGSLSTRYRTNLIFGRVLAPDPDRPLRVVLALNARKPGGPPAGLCKATAMRGGVGLGCTPYPAVFERTQVLTGGMMMFGSDAFITLSGVASDHVARLEVLLADGQTAEVPYDDNAYLVDVPRANLPARLVAYDADDRVIDVTRPWGDFWSRAQPARGRAISLIRLSGPRNATVELLVGPSSDGGECAYFKHFYDASHTGVSVGCARPQAPLELGAAGSPPWYVQGRVQLHVKRVRIRFAGGATAILTPVRGYVLWALPEAGTRPVAADGLDADGNVVATQAFELPVTRSRRSSSRD